MIPCKHCNTLNSLDSVFCKRCGTGIPEEDLLEARAKLEKIVADGFASLNEGRIEEALAIADAAVVSDPSSVNALSLKATCHERRGEIAAALEAVEKAVELNPDSELDKIKRNQLRHSLSLIAERSSEPDRRVAFAAAAAFVVLLVCGGLLYARANDRALEAAAQAKSQVAQKQPATTDASLQQFGTPQQYASNNAGQPNTGQGPVTQPSPTPPSDTTEEVPHLPRNTGAGLPPANGIGDQNTEIHPISPGSPPAGDGARVASQKGGDPDPVATTAPTENNTPAAPKGEVSITMSNPAAKRLVGGSQPAETGGAAKALESAANNDYQIGAFSSAAAKLEQALRQGGNQVSDNHRLAQVYENVGRKSDAIASYQRCIDACARDLAAGRGDTNRLKSVRDACQASLKQLQGG